VVEVFKGHFSNPPLIIGLARVLWHVVVSIFTRIRDLARELFLVVEKNLKVKTADDTLDLSTLGLSIVNFTDIKNAPKVWTEVATSSEDAWVWQSYTNFQLFLNAAEKFEPENKSFFIYLDGKPVGLAPLLIEKYPTTVHKEASFYGGPMPWPCFNAHQLGKAKVTLQAAEDFVFNELEKRATESGAVRIRLLYCPPNSNPKEDYERVSRIILGRKYLVTSINSHFMELTPHCFDEVRDRYRRYYKKFSPLFDFQIYEGATVTPELEQKYFELHIKDAGGQFRSRRSYEKQMDIYREGAGFIIVATHREKNHVAGMLLVESFKGASLDSSVAVDPDFQEMYVSHLMKWKALEELLVRKIRTYELGEMVALPTLEKIYSKKEVGISHFKEGWSRGGQRKVYVVEKFFDRKSLKINLDKKFQDLCTYFELNGDQ
jgi:hypothetical protein